MVGRFLAIIAGVAGAVAGSQAPGFTLQYVQNLSGRLEELRPIVEQFDADVARIGYTREKAMAECETASGLLDALCGGQATAIRRYETLSAHYAELKAASDYAQPIILLKSAGENAIIRELARSTAKEYKPAIPTTLDAAAYAGGGFAVLWGGISFVFGLLGSIFGMGRRYA